MTLTCHWPLLLPSTTNKTLFPTTHHVQTSRYQLWLQNADHHHSPFLFSASHHILSRPLHLLYFMVISSKKGEFTFFIGMTSKIIKIKMNGPPAHPNICLALRTLITQGPHPSSRASNKMQQIVIVKLQNGNYLLSSMINYLQEMKLFHLFLPAKLGYNNSFKFVMLIPRNQPEVVMVTMKSMNRT